MSEPAKHGKMTSRGTCDVKHATARLTTVSFRVLYARKLDQVSANFVPMSWFLLG